MSQFYTKKEFLTLFIPSVIITALLFGWMTWMENNYEKKQVYVADSYEMVVKKYQKEPDAIFEKGEENKLEESLKTRRIVVTENDEFIPRIAYFTLEAYGKIVSPKDRPYAQEPNEIENIKNFPPIETKVILYTKEDKGYNGPAIFSEVYYLDAENKVQRIFKGEGLIKTEN